MKTLIFLFALLSRESLAQDRCFRDLTSGRNPISAKAATERCKGLRGDSCFQDARRRASPLSVDESVAVCQEVYDGCYEINRRYGLPAAVEHCRRIVSESCYRRAIINGNIEDCRETQ